MYVIPTPPDDLSAEALTLWNTWHTDLSDEGFDPDARETAVLAETVRHLTLLNRLSDELAAGEVMVRGARGNMVVSPLIGKIDTLRRTVSTLLRSIQPPPTPQPRTSSGTYARSAYTGFGPE